MTTSIRLFNCGPAQTLESAWQTNGRVWWLRNRETSLNWLALGLLLAAWNASDDDPARPRLRPEALRRHASVSVRAATQVADGMGIHETVNML